MNTQHTPEPVAYRTIHYQDKTPNIGLHTDRKRAEWVHGYYGRKCDGVNQGSFDPLYLESDFKAVEQQRDELLDALVYLLDTFIRSECGFPSEYEIRVNAKETAQLAIAKARGKV